MLFLLLFYYFIFLTQYGPIRIRICPEYSSDPDLIPFMDFSNPNYPKSDRIWDPKLSKSFPKE